MTRIDAAYIIVLRLSKPPFLEDLLGIVAGERDTGTLKLESSPYARLELIRVLNAPSSEELDRELRSILEGEFGFVESYLPRAYLNVSRSLRKLLDIEGQPAKLTLEPSGQSDSTGSAWRGITHVVEEFFRETYNAMKETGESYDNALSIVASLLYGVYTRYVEASKLLGLNPGPDTGFREALSSVGGSGSIYLYSSIEKISKAASLWARDPVKYLVEEARAVYEASKTALYFSGGLLNILTHFFVTRYYESKLLRVIASRRFNPLAGG
ncbi:hypothetical protein ACSU1N_07160 [Thermogladius sp. 4427co]|uniref:hypothetical protein n=1 Tax=Thermogladius sp. 4427co TaxID=3450718 RepID=UPI003F7B301D